MSQSRLLVDGRFRALFATQFLGAFNDNLFKNAMLIDVVFRAKTLGSLDAQQIEALAGGLFVLPFFLFSAWAGLLSDRLPKARLIRAVRFAELPIMALGAAGFVLDDLRLLLAALSLMGLQATFFGPAKYSVLPELLREGELVGGTALIESGTFLAILAGTIGGGLLAARGQPWLIGGLAAAVAALGWITSWGVPPVPAAAPDLRVGLDPVRPMVETFRAARRGACAACGCRSSGCRGSGASDGRC
jgi:hypothetical protein